MENILEGIKELEKIDNVEERVEKLIAYLEQYLEYNSKEDVKKTGKNIIHTLQVIIYHLKVLRHHIKDKKLTKPMKQEIQVLVRIESLVIDMIRHPDHLHKDVNSVKFLEYFIKGLKNKETEFEKSFIKNN